MVWMIRKRRTKMMLELRIKVIRQLFRVSLSLRRENCIMKQRYSLDSAKSSFISYSHHILGLAPWTRLPIGRSSALILSPIM